MALDLFNVRAILSGSVTGTDAFDRFGSKLNSVGKTADNVNKQMHGLSKGMNALMGGLAGFSLANVIAEFARVTIQIDAYQKQLSIGFGGASTLQLEQLRKTFRNLGISQDEALGSAVRFTSAMKLSGNTASAVNKNFEAASKIVLANKLSADGANRVYYAMAQVASKGKLMSEELSGQLAENLAGIREQVAIALNVSSATLMEQMKEGKVSAEQFFEALRKIGDGIDPATLNSAAQSLGKLKNAWFDFKTSIIAVDSIKAALDLTTSALMVLTNNADVLKRVLSGVIQAIAGLAILRATGAILAFLIPNIYLAVASIRAFGLAAFFAFEGAQVLNLGMKALGIAAGPVGWAMTAAALAFGYFASGASKSEKAASALSESQQSMSDVIDMTTGKIISQNAALIENNRLIAVAAQKENELAVAEARSQTASALAPFQDVRFGAIGARADALRQAQSNFEQTDKGPDAVTAYSKAIKEVVKQFPDLARQLGDTDAIFQSLLDTTLKNEQSRIAVALASGNNSPEIVKAARGYGQLFDEGRGGSIKDGPKFDEAQTAMRGMQLQTALVGMSERYRFSIEKLNDAKLVSFDADGSLIVAATEYTEKVRQQAFALYDAQEAQNQGNQAAADAKSLAQSVVSELQSMDSSNAQLKDQIDNWNAMGDAVGKSEAALMEYATTQGKYATVSDKEKADLIAAARLTDQYRETIEGLQQTQKMAQAITAADKDIAKLRFKIQYFEQYGEAVDSSAEAMAIFDTTEGEWRNGTQEFKDAAVSRGKEVDELTARLKGMTAASKAASMVENFRQSASNKVQGVRQQVIALQGGSKSSVDRANLVQELNKSIEEDTRQATSDGMTGEQLKSFVNDLNTARDNALSEFDADTRKIEQMQGDWMVGAKAGLSGYYDQIKDVAGAMEAAFTNAFRGAEDALVNFVMTGKLSFRDLATSIVSDLARIAIQQAIMLPLMMWFKSLGFIPAANGAAFGSGGTVEKYAAGGVVSSPTAFRHSGGLGVMGEAGPEAIMPLRRLANGRLGVESSGNGTQNVTVNVSVESGSQKMQSDGGGDAKNLGKAIANVVRAELLAQKRPGGMLAA